VIQSDNVSVTASISEGRFADRNSSTISQTNSERSGASIAHLGDGNTSRITQENAGMSTASINQAGGGNSGTIEQVNGSNLVATINANQRGGLFGSGSGNTAKVYQTGSAQTAAVEQNGSVVSFAQALQYGDSQSSTIEQSVINGDAR